LSLTYNPAVELHKAFYTSFLRNTEIMQKSTAISVTIWPHWDGDRECTET